MTGTLCTNNGLVENVEAFRELKKGWETLEMAPFISHADAVHKHRVAGFEVSLLMVGEQSAGRTGAYLMRGKQGARVPSHFQTAEEEHFYVIDGEWEFLVGETVHHLGPGHFIFAPRHTPHAFAVLSEQGSVLSWNSPAGHERFFEEMVPLIEAGRIADVQEKAPKYETVF